MRQVELPVIRFASRPLSRWHNGAGRKADIASGDGWTAGVAWLDADAPFSQLSGTDRTITLVDGPGFTLAFAEHPPLVMEARYEPARFDGGWPTQCRIAGPCRVLNAMTGRDRSSHVATVAPVTGRLRLAPEQATLVVVLRGEASISEGSSTATLDPLDALLLDGEITIEGSDDLLIWRLQVASAG